MIAVAIVAVALVDGGYGGVAMGLGTLAIWASIVAVALFGGPRDPVPTGFLIAAGALAVVTVLAALSLGWSPDPEAGFTDVVRLSAYLGIFVLAGLLLRPGTGRAVLAGIGAGLVAVSVIALASRLLGLGAGDAPLAESFPSASGRLSYPLGYWNALGSMTAMAVPILVWLGAGSRGRYTSAVVLATLVPVLLATYMTSSRGAFIASVIGAGFAIATNPRRGRSFVVLLIGGAGAVPVVIAAVLANGILDGPWSGFGGAELVVCCAGALGMGIVALAGPPVLTRFRSARVGRLRMSHVVTATIAIIAGLTILIGPSKIAGDFAAKEGREAVGSGDSTISVTGSGRAQFWGAALDAFASEPGRGIGAGGYETWWNRHGSLETPAQNAHSEPLELLAELGPLGPLAFVVFFGVVGAVGVRRVRWRRCGAAGAALGLLATAMVGLLIDWTWDLPAVMLPVLISAAVLSTRALDYADESISYVPMLDRLRFVPAPALAIAAAVLAVPAVWAGGVLAVATERLEASDDALARGQLNDAAQAARSAASVEPWASAPWQQLATVEGAAGNFDASRRAVTVAIERSPEDFRPWLLASTIEAQLGNLDATTQYGARALVLAPLVLPRIVVDRGARPTYSP